MATIHGTAGDDNLYGVWSERNYIFGYSGDDFIVGSDYQDPVASMQGEGGDVLFGGHGHDVLKGLGGNDTIRGEDGDDVLDGGDGDDHLRGGRGVDYFDGGSGRDRISFFHLDATQGVRASLLAGTVWDDGYGNVEYFTGIEDLGQGTQFADLFEGDHSGNLFLADKDDEVYALDGDDRFELYGAPAIVDGGAGSDTVNRFSSMMLGADTTGDGLADLVYASAGVSIDLLYNIIIDDGFGNSGKIVSVENVGGSDFADLLRGDGGDNILWGLEDGDKLDGRDGDDTLEGGRGSDVLYGGDGHDLLVGGLDSDFLMGEGGKDIFRYDDALESSAATGADQIHMFQSGADILDLRNLADEVLGGGPLSFAPGGFTGTAGEITIQAFGGGAFVVEADLDGDFIADFAVEFTGTPALVFADIAI